MGTDYRDYEASLTEDADREQEEFEEYLDSLDKPWPKFKWFVSSRLWPYVKEHWIAITALIISIFK